jgi:hypothetical protein
MNRLIFLLHPAFSFKFRPVMVFPHKQVKNRIFESHVHSWDTSPLDGQYADVVRASNQSNIIDDNRFSACLSAAGQRDEKVKEKWTNVVPVFSWVLRSTVPANVHRSEPRFAEWLEYKLKLTLSIRLSLVSPKSKLPRFCSCFSHWYVSS